jgi:hypothetical protein
LTKSLKLKSGISQLDGNEDDEDTDEDNDNQEDESDG